MKREGIFENGITRPGGALNQLFALPADVLNGRDEGRVHLSRSRCTTTTTGRR